MTVLFPEARRFRQMRKIRAAKRRDAAVFSGLVAVYCPIIRWAAAEAKAKAGDPLDAGQDGWDHRVTLGARGGAGCAARPGGMCRGPAALRLRRCRCSLNRPGSISNPERRPDYETTEFAAVFEQKTDRGGEVGGLVGDHHQDQKGH
jgi:hypothetical protein